MMAAVAAAPWLLGATRDLSGLQDALDAAPDGPAFWKEVRAQFLLRPGLIHMNSATQCYVATHPDAAALSGEYWADCNVSRSSRHGADDAMAERLWTVSEEIAAKVE